jgi:molecular chaperone GrpE (heat shock protein)
MFKQLQKLFSSPKSHPDEDLALQREIQSLRLSLAELEKRYQSLAQNTQQERSSASQFQQAMMEHEMETLFTDLAAPASQLHTQQYLMNVRGQAVESKDVLTVAHRLLQALQQRGMEWMGDPGEQSTFQSDMHTPLSAQSAISDGEPVTIRFSGVKFGGKILRKAGVEKLESENLK